MNVFLFFFLNRYVLDVYNREKYCLFIFLFFNQFPGRKTPCVFFYNFFFVHKKKKNFFFFCFKFFFYSFNHTKTKTAPFCVSVCVSRSYGFLVFCVCISRCVSFFIIISASTHFYFVSLKLAKTSPKTRKKKNHALQNRNEKKNATLMMLCIHN